MYKSIHKFEKNTFFYLKITFQLFKFIVLSFFLNFLSYYIQKNNKETFSKILTKNRI